MDRLLESNPLLLLFLVAAIGYLVGNIKVKGASLGTAAVLFVGLAFGTLNPDYEVPEIVFQLGLIFFVYSIGLSSGPAFFQSFKKNGYRDIGFILLMLFISAAFAVIIHYVFGFNKATTVGIYSGSTTNTTAMAGVTDLINRSENINDEIEKLVVGFTYSYPMGVLGVMLVLKYSEKWLKVDYEAEKSILRKQNYSVDEELSSAAVEITNQEVHGQQLRDITTQLEIPIAYGRILKNGKVSIANWDTILHIGDILMVIGSINDIDSAIRKLGVISDENILDNFRDYEVKRIFVSNIDVVGKTISSLNLSEKLMQ